MTTAPHATGDQSADTGAPPAPDTGAEAGTEPDGADQPEQESGSEPKGGNAEAARYRTRLRETEAERDTLAGRLAIHQRREAERIAADVLAVPADLFDVHGVDLEEVLTDEGDVDPELVRMAAEQLVTDRPGLHRNARPVTPDLGQGRRGAAGAGRGPKTTWRDFLAGDV